MPTIIKHYGRPVEFVNEFGESVHRLDRIFVRSHNQWYETMDYDNHFIYKREKGYGSSLMCTCGSTAGAFDYNAYKSYSSYKGQLLCCVHYIQNGAHADGSH